MDLKMNILSGILTVYMFVATSVGRQMCYSCAYNFNALKAGYNCVTNPKNWTVGDWRMRCPNRCTSSSHYDKETGEATYFYRGCSGGDEVPEDGCTEDDLKFYCFYSCTGHYCNDGPAIDPKLFEKLKEVNPELTGSSFHVVVYSVLVVCLSLLVAMFIN